MSHYKSHREIHTGCSSPCIHTTLVLMGLREFRSCYFSLFLKGLGLLVQDGLLHSELFLKYHTLTLSVHNTIMLDTNNSQTTLDI